MKDEVGITDVLHEKVGHMDAEVERMRKVLQAKEAVLEDVLCTINQLPRHPDNTVLIRNILKSEVKQSQNSNLSDFKCHTAWSALFLENICIAIIVENGTHYTVLPSCAAVCNCDVSDTTTVIFDDLLTTEYIPPESKRTLLVSFRKGFLLNKQVILVLDCDFVAMSDSYSDLAILSFLPSSIHSRQTQIVNILDLDESLKKYSLSEMDDLSLKGFLYSVFVTSILRLL
uniref:FCP1 homology domain-containing protein n=1 Tax=Elaeophora elaphi TaxID=1147741 RepID=A0A158Q6Z6_9BILA